SRSHKSLNPLLMEVLRLGKYVDEVGRGKYLIYSGSLVKGQHPPSVLVERAGRYNRWKLRLNAGITDDKQIRLLEKLRDRYPEEAKAILAFALILWSQLPAEEIAKYLDQETGKAILGVLADPNGPIFLTGNKFFLRRWASVL